MYVCMYVCVCMYVYIYIYTNKYIYIYIYIDKQQSSVSIGTLCASGLSFKGAWILDTLSSTDLFTISQFESQS